MTPTRLTDVHHNIAPGPGNQECKAFNTWHLCCYVPVNVKRQSVILANAYEEGQVADC